MNPFEQIKKILDTEKVAYQIIDHEPVHTSKQAAQVRGLSMAEGAKSLLIKSNAAFFLVILPGNRKLDSKKIKTLLGTKKLRFATPEEVVQIMHCKIGACYPFGEIIGLKTVVDIELSKNTFISFNPGLHDKTIRIRWEDYQKITKPEIKDISKN